FCDVCEYAAQVHHARQPLEFVEPISGYGSLHHAVDVVHVGHLQPVLAQRRNDCRVSARTVAFEHDFHIGNFFLTFEHGSPRMRGSSRSSRHFTVLSTVVTAAPCTPAEAATPAVTRNVSPGSRHLT